jgi:hypothetical protein
MKKTITWMRVVFIVGVVAFCLGTLDPMEGSVVICAGSFMMALAAFFNKDRHWKWFLTLFIMMAVGVFFLFYLSSFGGLGEGALSWWFGLLMLPYPLAWLATVVLLIVRAFKKPKQAVTDIE